MAKGKGIPNQNYKEPITPQGRQLVGFEVAGTAPMIMNRFSRKAVEELLSKHMGRTVMKTKKVPRQCVQDALQINVNDAVAMPSTAFKKAILTGASVMKEYAKNKVPIRVGMHVVGASIPIFYSAIVPRMDIVRVGMGKPDVRFRPQLDNWTAKFVLKYDADTFADSAIVDFVDRAGSVGIGEWRPECDGSYGTFEIKRILNVDEVPDVMKSCGPIVKPVEIPEWAMDAEIDLDNLQKIMDDEANASTLAGETVANPDDPDSAAARGEALVADASAKIARKARR